MEAELRIAQPRKWTPSPMTETAVRDSQQFEIAGILRLTRKSEGRSSSPDPYQLDDRHNADDEQEQHIDLLKDLDMFHKIPAY